jgi:hypothetical protein
LGSLQSVFCRIRKVASSIGCGPVPSLEYSRCASSFSIDRQRIDMVKRTTTNKAAEPAPISTTTPATLPDPCFVGFKNLCVETFAGFSDIYYSGVPT